MHRLPSHDHHHTPAKPIRWKTVFAGLLIAWIATGVYTVGPGERAVVRRFGRALLDLQGPGLHFGLPYGVDQVDRVRVLERKRVAVGMNLTDRALGRLADPRAAECLTGDRNLIVAPAVAQYEVVDARAYLFHARDVDALVSSATSSALTTVISSRGVDDILTVDRLAIQVEIRRLAQPMLERYQTGIRITSVSLEGLAAPQEVAEAFRDVTRAREDRQRAINDADGYAKRLLPQSRGERERILLEAAGYGEEVVERARGETESFQKMRAEISLARDLTLRRLVLETAERVLPRLRKIVLDKETAASVDLGLLEDSE